MTKARDLAGFASSSVTTTASDGLVLKGDGSSTDVVIKNGANATVASVADGTVNITAAGSITATGASVGALARGSIQLKFNGCFWKPILNFILFLFQTGILYFQPS